MASYLSIKNIEIKSDHGELTLQILFMKNSFVLWVNNTNEFKMNGLEMAMSLKNIPEPSSLHLFGDNDHEELSSLLAKKLARKTGQQVFLSWNLSQSVQLQTRKEIEQLICSKVVDTVQKHTKS